MDTEAASSNLPLVRVPARPAPVLRPARLRARPVDRRPTPTDFAPVPEPKSGASNRTFVTSRAGYDHSWIGTLAIGLGLLAAGPVTHAADAVESPAGPAAAHVQVLAADLDA